MIYNKIKMNKKSAFSLAEVLISLLIISVILLLALPVITRKSDSINNSLKGGSKVFLFQEQSESDANFPCYVTTLDSTGNTTVVRDTNGKCQRYTFSVPNDVYKVDLTLVAGGGGGGGAAGGTVLKKVYSSTMTGSLELLHSRLKKIVVNALVSSGANGKERNKDSSSTIYAGQGGASGIAIINHELPSDFVNLGYKPDFLSEETSDSAFSLNFDIDETILAEMANQRACTKTLIFGNCSSLNGGEWKYLYDGIESYKGFGLMLKTNENIEVTGSGWFSSWTSLTQSKGSAAIFLSDGSSDENKIQCFTTYFDTDSNEYAWGAASETVAKSAIFSGVSISDDDAISSDFCKINNLSFIPSQKGKTSLLSSSDISNTISNGYLVQGGAGGTVSGLGSYGKGGKGQSAMILCANNNKNCSLPNNSDDTSTTTSVNKDKIKTIDAETGINNPYGKVTAYIANPGGSGSGGAGGSAIKINDFPVVPGSKYTIVVGSGGAGGASGHEGTINGVTGSYETRPQEGQNGTGGSSSAIYDEEGKLILLVIGGVGGYGGTINTAAQTLPSGSDLTGYAPLPNLPGSARNVPIVLSSDNDIFNKIIPLLDNKVVFSLETLGSGPANSIAAGYQARRIVNRFMTYNEDMERISPIYELNSNSSDVPSGGVVTATGEDDKTGGFSAFDNNTSRTLTQITKKPSAEYNGLDNSQEVYLGLYFRYLINNVYSYAGGLGGFSGLGTKAGCGGLFVGNSDGLLGNGLFNNSYKNTFMVNTAANGTNYVPYYINNYYGNCTVSNSDGQTADFVAPSYIPSAGEKLGSAGSGGGGGGWNLEFGSGKGGNGQNGYVMINWRY